MSSGTSSLDEFNPVPGSISDATFSFIDGDRDRLASESDSESSTPSPFDDPPLLDRHFSLEYVINHVFFPVYHPEHNDYTESNNYALTSFILTAAHTYHEHIDHAHQPHWHRITRMLENLQVMVEPTSIRKSYQTLDCNRILSQLGAMEVGDMLMFPISPHIASNSTFPLLYPGPTHGVMFSKRDHCTLYESLSVSKYPAGRKVLHSYPELAIEIPNSVFDHENFRSNLATSLSSGQLPSDLLHNVGHPAEPRHITKHVGPTSIIRHADFIPPGGRLAEWSRSSLWFLIRFSIQLSLDRSPLGQDTYRAFVLFFLCSLASQAVDIGLTSFLLHSISAKILRRLRKHGSAIPPRLSDIVLRTCITLSQTLDERWQEVQATHRSPLPWEPSQLDLALDTQPSLSQLHEYISTPREDRGCSPPNPPTLPNSRFRGTLDDFFADLDKFLSCPDHPSPHNDTHMTLYDVERLIWDDIDGWVACVVDVGEACRQLGDLVTQYTSCATRIYKNRWDINSIFGPDYLSSSIMLLTIIELWVALDKLVAREVPMLADYSPEVPMALLSSLLLRDDVSIHRCSHTYQYLLARHTQARPGWSVFSAEFTEDSFPCRYYDNSQTLQHLKAGIEDVLPDDPSYAKIVVFELHCPAFIDTWRAVTCELSRLTDKKMVNKKLNEEDVAVLQIPTLSPHILGEQRRSLTLYCSFSAPRRWDRLYYAYERDFLEYFQIAYRLPNGPFADSGLQRYLDDTAHTPNEVLAAQANCHPELSLHEFIAYGQLRSGGSLQWLNILRELRSRALNFRRQEVYLLLAQASAQVGPVDENGKQWWHQELQDHSFCRILLDELESLYFDTGTGSLDGPAMAIISLLASILASRQPGDISESAIKLLQNVRKRTFDWMHELLYEVVRSPTNTESIKLLRDLAAVCQSTYDLGSVSSHALISSSLDITTVLSCTMLIHRTAFVDLSNLPTYSLVLLDRHRRLSLILEDSLKDAIRADISDTGIDHAIQMVWPGYRPSPRRWEPLEPHNTRWLVCETATSGDRRSQTVHVNLLNGSLLVDGKPMGHQLPDDVTDDLRYRELFGRGNLMVVASDLPGMDFVTMFPVYDHYVHFVVQDHDRYSPGHKSILIHARCQVTDHVFELIPRHKLQLDLPMSLVQDHVHWLNLTTSIIEIRPLSEPWRRSTDNWSIHLGSGQCRITKAAELLVDKHSRTWSMVSSRLRCLDHPGNLIVSTTSPTPEAPRLSVTLPRYGLSFFVNDDGNLESCDFKNMVYDEDQYIGTLFGLINRLVLRHKTQIETDLIPKCILIPYGVRQVHDHAVHINTRPNGPVDHYVYQVDSELGCLTGIVDLQSRIYLSKLHFATGVGCRPDPLTGRTGAEEAISLVWTAATRGGTRGATSTLQSPQMRFSLAKIEASSSRESDLPSDDVLLKEAHLFPSEVAAGINLRNKGPLDPLERLFHERAAPNLRKRETLLHYTSGSRRLPSPNIDALRQLFSSLQTGETFQAQYLSRLHRSAHYFQAAESSDVISRPKSDDESPSVELLRKHYVQCRARYMESLDMIKISLSPRTEFERILDKCCQWPRTTPYTLFRCLASTSPIKLPEGWKKCIISLALLALDVQRARRLLRFALDDLKDEFYKEFENEGCDGWDAAEYPDWLLVQLQGNFLIRRVQADIAKEMISPRSGKNTVMQVNMGEGKTSVIVPICATALADGKRLVRVIVPKALIPQTIQVLTDRLCGLVNKPIYHLTFSRHLVKVKVHFTGEITVAELHDFVLKCKDERGIIVMQPEHVLSLKLACVETQLLEHRFGTGPTHQIQRGGFERVLHVLTGSLFKLLTKNTHASAVTSEAELLRCNSETQLRSIRRKRIDTVRSRQTTALKDLQRFLETHARDILDESDDVLRPQFQLVYAVGLQYPFEGSPDRWDIIQHVLRLVKCHTYFLSALDSHTIRCDTSSPGSFPHIHILRAEGGERVISLIVQDVLDGNLANVSFPAELGLRGPIHEFITRKDVNSDIAKVVEKYARQKAIWGPLLLLRGLLAHDILLFSLTQRRWRVDYGLDLMPLPRTMLAIPYRAKDLPAKTAEFGHPDITILLTCLSYYYRGLTEGQLRSSFELLAQQDDPSAEYALWLEDYGTMPIPNALRKLSNVNTRSFEQWTTHLYPLFTRNKRAIDLYLSRFVFPNHAKEFAQKISGSSWDIAEPKSHLVTGFSGTNDAQYLLPTAIVQDDQDHLRQSGTNARVLAYLLHPDNSSYVVTSDVNGDRWTTLQLLSAIASQNPEIRVLLDIGAQILDLSNLQLAWAWLDRTTTTETDGAIFFNKYDELMVLTRDGIVQSLSSSPLVRRLHRCVAYLDDAHTRGTDFKFPLGFRAAVTLGHKVTKDRLVQGCMRMRKLGHGHSVMFFAPHEVDQRIRVLAGKVNQNSTITTADILHWTIEETWNDIKRQSLNWAQQGMNHQSRYETWARFCDNRATPEELGNTWVQPELKSLANMYMPCHPTTASSANLPRQIRDRCASLGILSLPDARIDEEQEREVSREIEREREIERPPKASPATHSLHPDLVLFVKSGVVPSPSWSEAFRYVFATSVNSSLIASNEQHAWSPSILATADFSETILESESVQGRANDYLRPVMWVLSGKMRGRDALVLVSPFEVDRLMPEIRISEHVHLHLYVPRTTKRMKPSDDLKLYSIPPVPSDWTPPWALIDQLNLFAGQLYLSDYPSYVRMCRFLGVYTEDQPQGAGTACRRSWFYDSASSDAEIRNRFDGTPMPLAMQLLVKRGMGFGGTHMGRILEGMPLTEEEFQRSGTSVVKVD